jgi:outer membrane lipase/esterase
MKSLKRHLAVLLGATAMLAACGGGGEQVEKFKPARLIVFGDETSALRPDGTKYTVNGINTTTNALDCSLNTLWVQSLSITFGLVFQECNPDKLATPTAKMYAAAGAKVADIATQVDRQLALDGFNGKDLVTVLAGANDVLELYAQFPAQDAATLGNAAQARGEALAAQVNRIAAAGGKVILSTMQDMGLTPFARKQKAANADTDRAALLTELSRRFNTGLRLKIVNDGRQIGLVLTDETMQSDYRYSSYWGYTNVTDPSCLATSLPPVCTDKTLVTGATAANYFFAGDVLLGPQLHGRIGSIAVSRATNNPF